MHTPACLCLLLQRRTPDRGFSAARFVPGTKVGMCVRCAEANQVLDFVLAHPPVRQAIERFVDSLLSGTSTDACCGVILAGLGAVGSEDLGAGCDWQDDVVPFCRYAGWP